MNLRHLKRPARPRFAPAAVDLLPQDLPRIESREIAASVFAPRMGPAMKPGKGVHDADTAWASNVVAMDELRGKGKRCAHCLGRNAVTAVRFRGEQDSVNLCAGCRPLGALGVVGPDGAA